ncbi:hypothetical protein ACFLRF_05140 [Candidatus Altiarchaeota archaeon]
MHRKAQLSTEFLVILSIIIIIALVVVVLLGDYIDISAEAARKSSRAYWKTTKVGILNWVVNESGDALFSIRNNHDTAITINGFRVNNVELIASPVILRVGEKTLLSGDVGGGQGEYRYSIEADYETDGIDKKFISEKKLEGRYNH